MSLEASESILVMKPKIDQLLASILNFWRHWISRKWTNYIICSWSDLYKHVIAQDVWTYLKKLWSQELGTADLVDFCEADFNVLTKSVSSGPRGRYLDSNGLKQLRIAQDWTTMHFDTPAHASAFRYGARSRSWIFYVNFDFWLQRSIKKFWGLEWKICSYRFFLIWMKWPRATPQRSPRSLTHPTISFLTQANFRFLNF